MNETTDTRASGRFSRRAFVRRTGALAGGTALAGGVCDATEPQSAASRSTSTSTMPRAVLGKTGVRVSRLTLGTAPCGHSRQITAEEVAQVVRTALDAGVDSIDTAPIYGNAEEGVGLALGAARKNVFLATKVWADTVADAERSLANSLRLLKTDAVDLLYYHNLGARQVDRALDDDGVLTWLFQQKQAGKTRFVGISGHSHADRFIPLLETGRIDVALMLLNFADRFTYHIEQKVLGVAREHNVGVVGMKVFAGIRGGFKNYGGPPAPPQLPEKHLESAVRYSLGLPGVATLNIGAHLPEQVKKNAAMVADFRPLDAQEQAELLEIGRHLAEQWGPRFGPVG